MIVVVCHDAGGAEILSSLVRQQSLNCLYVLDGPAVSIFQRKLGDIVNCSLPEALNQASSVLCGTSWQSDLEFNALRIARSHGKKSIAFIDHWVNYSERFERDGEIVYPDEIWVGDSIAQSMAEISFPSLTIKLVQNPYLIELQKEYQSFFVENKSNFDCESINILYVCEPISKHALQRYGAERFWGYTEDDALRYFLSNIAVVNKRINKILIRPHPSESHDKYIWARKEYDLPIEFGGERKLIDEIYDCNMVVGCESMALVVALLFNKKVVSCIPPNGRACVLPQKEIINFRCMIENERSIYVNDK